MTVIDIVKNGGTILYPSDTVWGIGGDATNTNVINKIFAIKKRDPSKSLLLLVDSYKMLQKYVEEISLEVWEILEKSVVPTTIIYSNPKNLPKELLATDGSIAIRVIKNGFAKDLIKSIQKPLLSTSANLSGEPTPKCFKEVSTVILQKVDYVVNLHHKTIMDKPSRIIKWTKENGVEIIRD